MFDRKWLEQVLEHATLASFDVEDEDGHPVMVGFGLDTEDIFQVTGKDILDEVPEIIRMIKAAGIPLVAFNGAYDVKVLMQAARAAGRDWVIRYDYDVYTIARWIWKQPEYGLKPLAVAILGREPRDTIGDLIKQYGSVSQIPYHLLQAYNAADCRDTLDLAKVQLETVRQRKLITVARLEAQMSTITAKMELAGVMVDQAALEEIKTDLRAEVDEINRKLFELRGRPVHISAYRDVSDFLFKEMGVPSEGIPKTKSGHPSTNADYLDPLAGEYPAVDLICQYRQINSLLTTFVPALRASTERIHSHWRSIGTHTGRMSVSGPNWHSTPKHSERGLKLRKAVVAPKGKRLVSVDFSQIQLRVLAVTLDAKPLIEMFRQGVDIHRETASIMYHCNPEYVTKQQRQNAKAVNFNLVFGGGPGVFLQFGYTWEEARRLYQNFFEHYGMVDGLIRQKAQIWKGHVRTFHGRIISLPSVKRSDSAARIRGIERLVINYPCQGGEADLVKIGMLRIDGMIENYPSIHAGAELLLAIHDELVYEVDEDCVNDFAKMIIFQLTSIPYPCPLAVDVEVGQNWYDMEEWHE